MSKKVRGPAERKGRKGKMKAWKAAKSSGRYQNHKAQKATGKISRNGYFAGGGPLLQAMARGMNEVVQKQLERLSRKEEADKET